VTDASQADLLLWPESAVPETDLPTCQAISRFAQSNRVWIILNGEDAEYLPATTNYFNAAYVVGPDGRWLQVYHKLKLVIFGEYVPLTRWLPFLKYLTPIGTGWVPGDKAVQFQMQVEGRESRVESKNVGVQASAWPTNTLKRELLHIKSSPLICFEDVFPGLARDAADGNTDFLVNLTNDGWFRQSAEQWQHMANAVFRAVENGVPLVRCANNGITCWIDASGRRCEILKDNSGSVYGVAAITVEIPVGESHAPTFYHRHGDWFGWVCVVWTAMLALRRIFIHPK
jgi:apolipoprotein N-acyltransferase